MDPAVVPVSELLKLGAAHVQIPSDALPAFMLSGGDEQLSANMLGLTVGQLLAAQFGMHITTRDSRFEDVRHDQNGWHRDEHPKNFSADAFAKMVLPFPIELNPPTVVRLFSGHKVQAPTGFVTLLLCHPRAVWHRADNIGAERRTVLTQGFDLKRI